MAGTVYVCRIGRMAYQQAFELQTRLVNRLAGERAGDWGYLLLVEHPATFTMGRSASRDNVLASEDELAAAGAILVETNRGGDVTFHGPGQVVAYPILHLTSDPPEVHGYLRRLEETLIRAIAHFGVVAGRKPGLTGVWVGEEKVAAIGVAIRRWITYHGIALNVSVDLGYFRLIHPCGIRDRGVTSLERILSRPVEMEEAQAALTAAFGQVFEAELQPITLEALTQDVAQ